MGWGEGEGMGVGEAMGTGIGMKMKKKCLFSFINKEKRVNLQTFFIQN